MKDFTLAFKTAAQGFGADLVGIAPIERFSGIKPEHHPASIFPEVKSVIIIGKRITRGTLRGVEEGTQFETYEQYGYAWLENRFLAMATFKTAEYLEDNGWEAVPLPNIPVQTAPMGIAVRPGQPAPNVLVDADDAAVRAGLGEIGYLDVFLTPQFGPRQRFQMILTDAPLEETPLLKDAICPADASFKDFCPLNAIRTDADKTLEICGKKMSVAKIDYTVCSRCKNGTLPNRWHPSGHPDRLGALCIRNLVEYLEKNKKLLTQFAHPFRKRKPWQAAEHVTFSEAGSDIE